MPYIEYRRRVCLAGDSPPRTPGELTYLFTRSLLGSPTPDILRAALDRHVALYRDYAGEDSFSTFAEILGSLAATELEYLRREPELRPSERVDGSMLGELDSAALDLYGSAVAPYEDAKKAENGDVYL